MVGGSRYLSVSPNSPFHPLLTKRPAGSPSKVTLVRLPDSLSVMLGFISNCLVVSIPSRPVICPALFSEPETLRLFGVHELSSLLADLTRRKSINPHCLSFPAS